MNLPNKITASRFFLSLVYFVLLYLADSREHQAASSETLLIAASVIFLIAVLTDMLDGYVARKYHSETHLGRIADPLVDKVIICGSMVFFLGFARLSDIYYTWMVVVIMVREFIIHGVRTMAERQGIPFGATFWGKQKMFLQSVTVGGTLFYLTFPQTAPWSEAVVRALLWVTVASTLVSGLVYAIQARAVFHEKSS